ncbi:MAG: putative endonuclease [Ignavibacteria bacterium]|nr:MAG: putative endonuclease [Ignavibacteria bacterium]KAF0160528.1 MAG: putative endonuclease [Ignavibacteria bacterium]
MKEYYVYILQSMNNDKTYVGQTENLERRLKEHNSGKTSYTAKYVPWKIVYFEKYSTREESLKREKYLKSSAGRRFIKVLLNTNCPGSSVDRAAVS